MRGLGLIILLGMVSLFGDITYEGAKSVSGPYFATLGASAVVVGLVAGICEFVGYSFCLPFGYLSDRTGSYWLMTFIGYAMLISIPLLALASYWEIAAILILLERLGKAIRRPARDAMLSYATRQVGRGWGFGIHEALDQVGAVAGPLLLSLVFLLNGSYQDGFAILWIPALLALFTLALAREKFPLPQKLEADEIKKRDAQSLPKAFWLYIIFSFLSIAGFAHFLLISYHFKVYSIIPDAQIPMLYAIAMSVDALVALFIGRIYDKVGLALLSAIPLLTISIPFLVFSYSRSLVLAGVVLWGMVMGIQEVVMRAAVADLAPVERRGFAYGVFSAIYGMAWLLGSPLMGWLYKLSIDYLILFVILIELVSIPLIPLVKRDFLAPHRLKL